jgi:hypothetical protein
VTTCRICGEACEADEIRPVYEGGGCGRCNGSPACARCGHPRRHHRGTFGGGDARCTAAVSADAALAVGRCGCAGYTTDRAAFGEAVEIVDIVEPRLRTANEESAPQRPRLAPARDLFDEGRRLRDLSELKRVPWRPHR